MIAVLRRHGAHRDLLHHPVLLDDRLLAATPHRRAEHRVHPEPGVDRELQGRVRGQNNFGRSLINSVIVAGTTTILILLIGIIAAYALARLRFRGKVAGALADHGLLDVPAASCCCRRC